MSSLTVPDRADAPAGTRPLPGGRHRMLPTLVRRTLARIAGALSARRTARQLAELDDRLLRDIGLRRSGSRYVDHRGPDIVALAPPLTARYLDAVAEPDKSSLTADHDP